ncbi:MAG: hypothetical protein Q8K75_12910 [Chlamydiales bacterium]|nr:hypothetical protein [Chlamydiales bacterium]
MNVSLPLFENGYSSTGGKFPSPEERELYILWEALRIIARFSNNPALDDERLEKLKICTAKLQELSL